MVGKKDDGSAYKIMIVDDSIFVQHQMEKILVPEGFEIIDFASSGKEAVDKYQAYYPSVDLVTMDVTMPGMHGVEALKEIKKIDPEACVVIVSALGKTDLMKDAFMQGAAHYVIKPIERDNLLKILEYALKSRAVS